MLYPFPAPQPHGTFIAPGAPASTTSPSSRGAPMMMTVGEAGAGGEEGASPPPSVPLPPPLGGAGFGHAVLDDEDDDDAAAAAVLESVSVPVSFAAPTTASLPQGSGATIHQPSPVPMIFAPHVVPSAVDAGVKVVIDVYGAVSILEAELGGGARACVHVTRRVTHTMRLKAGLPGSVTPCHFDPRDTVSGVSRVLLSHSHI